MVWGHPPTLDSPCLDGSWKLGASSRDEATSLRCRVRMETTHVGGGGWLQHMLGASVVWFLPRSALQVLTFSLQAFEEDLA